MGRTYHANNSDETFDVNFSGVDVLSYIGEVIQSGVIPNKYFYNDMMIGRFLVKSEMEEAECKYTASAIRNLSDDEIDNIYEVITKTGLWDKSASILDFKNFISQWCIFLDNCGGCKSS